MLDIESPECMCDLLKDTIKEFIEYEESYRDLDWVIEEAGSYTRLPESCACDIFNTIKEFLEKEIEEHQVEDYEEYLGILEANNEYKELQCWLG